MAPQIPRPPDYPLEAPSFANSLRHQYPKLQAQCNMSCLPLKALILASRSVGIERRINEI